MANCAVLIAHGRLVVRSGRAGRIYVPRLQRDVAVAFQTELIDVVALQQLWIACSVRRVADRAPFNFRGRMLKHKGPLLVGVALHACGVGACIEPGLLRFESTVRVMAVAALHRAFEDPVMERLCELGLRFVVTSHAQLRLVSHQHFGRRQVV